MPTIIKFSAHKVENGVLKLYNAKPTNIHCLVSVIWFQAGVMNAQSFIAKCLQYHT